MSEKDSDLILSAYEADSSEVFPKILDLHASEGDSIADVTYGKGVFWQEIDKDKYELVATDIDPDNSPDSEEGIDCRDLPHDDESFDVVVLDPPHIEGFYRRNKEQLFGSNGNTDFGEAYSNGELIEGAGKYHQRVLNMYFAAGKEAKRVLKDDGIIVAKIADEVCSNKQELTHIQVTNFYQKELNLYPRDLFVQMRSNKPHMNGVDSQVHARKNHSYYMVYQKTDTHRSS